MVEQLSINWSVASHAYKRFQPILFFEELSHSFDSDALAFGLSSEDLRMKPHIVGVGNSVSVIHIGSDTKIQFPVLLNGKNIGVYSLTFSNPSRWNNGTLSHLSYVAEKNCATISSQVIRDSGHVSLQRYDLWSVPFPGISDLQGIVQGSGGLDKDVGSLARAHKMYVDRLC